MPERRFPRPDGDFDAYMSHYSNAVDKFWNVHGLNPADLAAFKDALSAWFSAYPGHIAATAAAQAASRAKAAARREVERQARPVTAFIQSFPATTDADRAAIGITVRDAQGTPAPTPTTRPRAIVRSGSRLTHTLRLSDEATPTRRARPKGVLGAEVWVKLVDAGAPANPPLAASLGDPATFAFLTMATGPSVTAEYRAADGGRTAVYMLRWVNTRGEKGPWSEVTTATVAA